MERLAETEAPDGGAGVGKPPYAVPSLAEVRAAVTHGRTVASTFAGCGGSSTGYRLAGYRVVWANEFIPLAAETYAANYPETPLDRRDIRTVRGAEILAAAGLQPGELDVLDGSPPCASFSAQGKGAKLWGEVRPYSSTKQRVDDLFDQYLRLVERSRRASRSPRTSAGSSRGPARASSSGFSRGSTGSGTSRARGSSTRSGSASRSVASAS